jgi:hypothetical protein
MLDGNLNQQTNEFQFSFNTNTANKSFVFEEFDDLNSDMHRISLQNKELPPPSAVTRMVPCPPCTWG